MKTQLRMLETFLDSKRKQTTTQSKHKKLKKKENKGVKDKILRDIRNLFEQEVKDYYKPVR